MEYHFQEIERKWQAAWKAHKTYHVSEDSTRPKYYVLNMFPYPSGAGLHVGHPLGYIASDIYARYKRLRGYNVLNPMGYDAYGLPGRAICHTNRPTPAITTVNNINRYRSQLDKIGFSLTGTVRCARATRSIIIGRNGPFSSCSAATMTTARKKAEPISKLTSHLAAHGTEGLDAAQTEELHLTADEWNAMTDVQQQQTLMNYRIAYLGETMVNWCPKLGTVLANDEVVDGVSERGGYPVVQKK